MATPSPMQILRELTKQDSPKEAKKAFAKQLLGRKIADKQVPGRKVSDQDALQTTSGSHLLRLARRHAPDLLGPYAPKAPAKKS